MLRFITLAALCCLCSGCSSETATEGVVTTDMRADVVVQDMLPDEESAQEEISGAADADLHDMGADTGQDLSAEVTTVDMEEGTEPGDEFSCGTDSVGFSTLALNNVSLQVACQGEGETILFLHGFPEFWYGWKGVMESLSDEYRVVAPDQRGYNLSDKPPEISDYEISHLAADIVDLIHGISDDPIWLVGHDWGGVVAWVVAHQNPELLKGLIIANGPHPDIFARELSENPAQQEASGYIDFLVPAGSELILSANNFEVAADLMFTDVFTEEDRAAYLEAWGQPDAMRSMINWYRANIEGSADGTAIVSDVTISVPTLVLWGMLDEALLPGNIEGLEAYVSDLEIIEFPDASHWINHEYPEEMAVEIRGFIAR